MNNNSNVTDNTMVTTTTVNSDNTVTFAQESTKDDSVVFRDFDYDKTPIVDLVNIMIEDAVNKRASDIHFDPTPDYLNGRIRIDGD